ncbi:iron-containing alcohol dehydrogenase [Spirochaeta dissipatitropha]
MNMKLLIDENALELLPAELARLYPGREICLVSDANTRSAAGQRAESLLASSGIRVHRIDLGGKVQADADNFLLLLSKLDNHSVIAACGSGTINDLCRYAAFRMNLPYFVIATAPSMDGYASHVSPITIHGVKQTFPAVIPDLVCADISVLKAAPFGMIQAGFGDMIGKITSLLDWKLSALLTGEPINNDSLILMQSQLDNMLCLTVDISGCSSDCIEALARGLIGSGTAMYLAGSSRPASGSEHHISHYLEMCGEMHERSLPPHGIKVALGLWFSGKMYEELYRMDLSKLAVEHDWQGREDRIRRYYGERSDSVLQILRQRRNTDVLDTITLQKKAAEVHDLIGKHLETLQRIPEYLESSGIWQRDDLAGIPNDWIYAAVRSGFEIRDRFTIAVLLEVTGQLEGISSKLLKEYGDPPESQE